MADSNNQGQFGNREDTRKQASKGGQASPGKFGSEKGADPHKAGSAGAAAQPRAAKVEGGKKGGSFSRRGGDND
ncbi:MAG TPA: hypothetical protein VFT59_02440 [Candidatus Saccharimonadales bacterium]|nr:hypothetical protein [Candidatus Saccharimonadales bacterium]